MKKWLSQIPSVQRIFRAALKFVSVSWCWCRYSFKTRQPLLWTSYSQLRWPTSTGNISSVPQVPYINCLVTSKGGSTYSKWVDIIPLNVELSHFIISRFSNVCQALMTFANENGCLNFHPSHRFIPAISAW